MHRDIQRDGEIDTEMMTQTHIHRNGERAERRPRNKCKRNAIPQDHTSSCTGCALSNSKECHFHMCHDVTAPPELCNSASLPQKPWAPAANGKVLIDKWNLNCKTVREWLHSLQTLMGKRIRERGKKIPEKEMMLLIVPILIWLCNRRGPPAQGAQATSWFFQRSKVLRNNWVLSMQRLPGALSYICSDLPKLSPLGH